MRTFRRLLIGLLAIGLTHSAALPGSAATTLPDIRGIYVIGQKFFLGNGQLAQAIASPAVDGILVDLDWTDVASATATKTYDWTTWLDPRRHDAILGVRSSAARARGRLREFRVCAGRQTRRHLHS